MNPVYGRILRDVPPWEAARPEIFLHSCFETHYPNPERPELTDFQQFAARSLNGGVLSRDECRQVLACPDSELLPLLHAAYQVRHRHFGNTVQIQILSNAKSGLCPEDCRYCSQSRVSKAKVEQYPLVAQEKLMADARHAKDLAARRLCMAISGRSPSADEMDQLCETIRAIKQETDISLCGSLGLLSLEQAKRLKAAGLDRANHNLNTSERYHPEVCTTHTYEDRVATLKNCVAAGLEVCSGGIVGQGETDEDIIDLLLALRELGPDALPINFLVPVEGTPFADAAGDLTPRRCLKVLCLARFLHPKTELRAAGGREFHIRSLQPLAFYPADSAFVSGYLTTGGQSVEDARRMIADLGFDLEIEGAEAPPETAEAPAGSLG
jgi:biotin synthase